MHRIRELRKKKGMTMLEAAKALGMPYTTYANYERGLREPKQEVLRQLAAFYEVSVDELLGAEASSKRPVTEDDIKFALFGGEGEITDSMYEEVLSFAAFVRRREEERRRKE